MSKQVVIDVPDWVDDSLAEKLKKMLIAKIREEIERDYTDMKLYNLYFTMCFPETGNVEFDLKEELKMLKEMRKKGRERAEW